jgi:transmembrane sensor
MNQKIDKILVKFFMNVANIDDLETLTEWLKKKEHKQIFKNHVKTNYAIDINMNEFDTESAKKEYLNKIRQEKKSVYKFKNYKILKYAAAAVIIFVIGYLFQQETYNNNPIIANNQIESGTDKATLTLENGEKVTLIKGASFQTKNTRSNGAKIVYGASIGKTTEIAYNYLTIPRGGKFLLQLSDGTKVWLNSETQLKYPVSFIDNETRLVELIYGEAYFDVSPSTKHNGTNFKVIQNKQKVLVLGTEFNIKAYKDETTIYTTLVEGKVLISIDGKKQNLVPNQQSSLNLNTNKIEIKTVDVYNQTSWKEGVFSFENQSLKEILKVVSRWYDIEVVFKNKEVENEEFIGVLVKDQNLEEILSNIKNFGIIKDFKIQDKMVILE